MPETKFWSTANDALNSAERKEFNYWRHWMLYYLGKTRLRYQKLIEKYDVRPEDDGRDPFEKLTGYLSAIPAFDDPPTSLARLRNLAADASQALTNRHGDPATRAAEAATLIGTILGEIRALSEAGVELVRLDAPQEGGEVSGAPVLIVNDVTSSGSPRLGGGLVEAAPE